MGAHRTDAGPVLARRAGPLPPAAGHLPPARPGHHGHLQPLLGAALVRGARRLRSRRRRRPVRALCRPRHRTPGRPISYASTFNEANIQRLLAMIPRTGERHATVAGMLAACAQACGDARFSSLLFADPAKTEPVLLDAHRKATAAIKAGPGDFPVGLTLTMQDIQAPPPVAAHLENTLYGPWLDEAARSDFIGVQTYTRILMQADGSIAAPAGAEMTAAGYEFYPQALTGTIRLAAARTGRPVYVTENGIATDDDTRRVAFIDGALEALRGCVDEGIDVRGYIHWSLLDNFEWTSGYGHRFGLVDVDYATFKRTIKPSGRHLGALAAKEQQS